MFTRTRLTYDFYSKLLILLIGFFGFQFSTLGQHTPQAVNYQAVARDLDGIPFSEIVLNVEVSIVQNNPNGDEVYAELHEVVTDVFGLFNLKIGNGIVLNGVFSEINWGNDISFLKVSIDAGQGSFQMPTVQLLSVPYALHAASADSASYGSDEDANPSNEIQELQLNGQELTLTNDPSGTIVDLGTASSDDQQLAVADQNTSEVTLSLESSDPATFSIEDLDANPGNEIQLLNKTGNLVELSNGGGSFIDEVDDADANAANELQTIDKTGNTVTLSDDGGSFIDEVDDADANASNELQTIDKAGNTVTLSDDGGSFIDEVDDADANATNELQTISKSVNTVTLSNGGGSFTDEIDDADSDPANELQTISKALNTVTLSDGGGSFNDEVNDADADPTNEQITTLNLTGASVLQIAEGSNNQSVDLSALKVDDSWTPNGNDIRNSNTGNVGINEANPTSTLFINGSTGALVRTELQSGSNYVLGEESIFIGKPELGDVEVDLPKASTVPGRIYHIRNGHKNVASDVIIHAFAGDFINYETFWTLRTLDYSSSGNTTDDTEGITIISDGIDTWWIISSY